MQDVFVLYPIVFVNAVHAIKEMGKLNIVKAFKPCMFGLLINPIVE